MKKLITAVLFIIVFVPIWSQTNSFVSLDFKDVHLADVDHVIMDQKGQYFFTSDLNGKILMWRIDDFSFVKTIEKGKGSRIVGMSWTDNGETLITSTGHQGRYILFGERQTYTYNTEGDQLAFYSPWGEDSVRYLNSSVDILGNVSDSILMLGLGDDASNWILGLEKTGKKQELFRIEADKIVSRAVITNNREFIAFTENHRDITSFDTKEGFVVKIMRLNSKELLFSKKYINEQVITILFNPAENSLHVLIFNRDKQMMRIEEVDLESFKSKEYYTLEMRDAPNSVLIQNQAQLNRTVIFTGLFSSDHIFHFKEGKLEKMNILFEKRQNPMQISAMAFVPNTDYLACWNSINSFFGNNPEFNVWNFKSKSSVNRFFESPRTELKGVFLPEDNWMVFGKEAYSGSFSMLSPMKPFIKFYDKGTLNNRFAQLRMTDYIHQKFGISFYSEDVYFALDEQSGSMVFAANLPSAEAYTNRLAYVTYDLIKNEIDTSNALKVDFMIPIAFAKSKNRLLVKNYLFGDQYKIIEGNKSIDFKEAYSIAHLSKSGDFLFFMDQEGELKIYSFEKEKFIYTEKNVAWSQHQEFITGTGGLNEFWISYITDDSLVNSKKYFTQIFNCEASSVSQVNIDKTWVSNVAIGGEQTAIVLDGAGVFLGENRMISFDFMQIPKSVSLNRTGDRLMVALPNGTIELYDTKSLKCIGKMYHPDNHSYIIIDSNGYFASNTRIDSYLTANKDGKIENTETLNSSQNRPDKILELFGVPDSEYKKMLEMVSSTNQFRNANTEINSPLPSIIDVKVNKLTSFSSTNNKTVLIELKGQSENADITKLSVKVNDVPTLSKDITFKKGQIGTVSFDLELQPGENTLSFKLIDQLGVSSCSTLKTVFYTKDIKEKGNLYVLAIGISDYPEENNDLTFADKDALDFGLLYSDSISFDLENYKNKFLGYRYEVNSQKTEHFKEIRLFSGEFGSGASLIQVDLAGRYWLEVINYEDFYLWDFQLGNREKIEINMNVSSWGDYLMMDPTGKGFCFEDKKSNWQHYSFEKKKSEILQVPETYHKLFLGNDTWLVKNESTEKNVTTISLGTTKGKNSAVDFDVTFQQDGNNDYTLLASRLDHSSVLLASFSSLHLVQKKGSQTVVNELQWKTFSPLDEYSFSSDGLQVLCLKTIYSTDTIRNTEAGKLLYTYDLVHNTIDSVFFEDPDFKKFTGININGGLLRWINTADPLADSEAFLSDESAKRNQLKPVSFDKTFVKVLLNDKATKEGILAEMDQFLTKATAEDEVIVFFAGHGMLDSTLNFHFASYDVDFNNPAQKGVSYDLILNKLGQLPMTRKLLLLDACHAGNIFSPVFVPKTAKELELSAKRGASAESVGGGEVNHDISEIYDALFGTITDQYGVTVIAASSGVNLAYESKTVSNGAFTSAYIESILSNFRDYFNISIDLNTLKPVYLTNEVLYSIRKKVLKDTNGQQIPSVRSLNNRSNIRLF